MIETAMNRVLIVMMSAVGDTVHVLPLINAIKRARPEAHITWVLQPGPASLVRGHPAVDEIIVFDKKHGWRAFRDVRAAMREPYDLVIDLQVYIKAGLITLLAPSPLKLGFDRARARDLNWLVTNRRIPPHEPQHVQDQYLEFLQELDIPAEPVVWSLGPWHGERTWQHDFFSRIARPVVTLVIGSSHAQKEWMPERWAALADALFERYGLQPVLAGARSDAELRTASAILERTRHAPISTLGVPLRQLVGLLDGSPLVVSLDTAPLHMAVALDRPVISLMGYNNPKRVGPYRRFQDLVVDAYGEAGEDYPISIAHRMNRMPRISVERVLEKVDLWQSSYRDAAVATVRRMVGRAAS